MKKECLFYTNLTQETSGIKAQRAGILLKNTHSAQVALIQEIQGRIDKKDEEELNLTDLSPENTYDLKPGGANFDSKTWSAKLQDISVEKLEIEVELIAAKRNYKKWYGEEYVNPFVLEEDTTDE